jgi:hypothetical protein
VKEPSPIDSLNFMLGMWLLSNYSRKGKGKGKAVPLQAWSGPEGSRKFRFPDFMITAQDGGKVVSLTHRPPLTPGNTPGVLLEAESTPKTIVRPAGLCR